MIAIRLAHIDDIDWIVQEIKLFAELYGTKRSLVIDEHYTRTGLQNVIEKHIFLIAESNGERAGMIAGLLSPHLFNPAIRTLFEIFWWVSTPCRNTRIGYMLLKEYVRIGKEKADWVTLSSIVNYPINERVLLRSGFKLLERSYLLEV